MLSCLVQGCERQVPMLLVALFLACFAGQHKTTIKLGSENNNRAHRIIANNSPRPPGCGTDNNGNPSDNMQCGVSGTNPYTGENATDLMDWCGGKLPGACKAIVECNPALTSGKFNSHKKYYLSADLNCGASSLAVTPVEYVDFNLNRHTLTGAVFLNGGLRGFHFFNGTLNCSIQSPSRLGPGSFAYGCLDNENNGGTYRSGGGDQIKIHHVSGQNSFACSGYMRFTGGPRASAEGWTEPVIQVYNNTFQSVPETSCARQHAGIYSETQPVEYFNNLGDCGSNGQANACQISEIYGKGGHSYIHHNKFTCGIFNVKDGDTCRQILIDGGVNARVEYNDLYPNNNRAIRLRDAFHAEVDHNFIHELSSANGYPGTGLHTGDNDINSGRGQILNQNIHQNTFELGLNARAILIAGQQGVTSESDSYLCAAAGCSGAQLVVVGNGPSPFGTSATVNASAKTITQVTGNFRSGTSASVGSILSFMGFSNPGNNNIFTVTAITRTVLTLSDPKGLLVNETSTKATYAGVAQGALYRPKISGGLSPNVMVLQAAPTATLKYCGDPMLMVRGTGSLIALVPPCP